MKRRDFFATAAALALSPAATKAAETSFDKLVRCRIQRNLAIGGYAPGVLLHFDGTSWVEQGECIVYDEYEFQGVPDQAHGYCSESSMKLLWADTL